MLFFVSAAVVCMGTKLRGASQDDLEDRDLAVCKNTAASGAIDRGCSQELPVCVSSKGRFMLLKHRNGGKCARCVQLPGRWPFQRHQGCIDKPCPPDQPQCDKVEYEKIKDSCKRDFACPPDRPQCLTADYKEPKVWFAGMMCIDGTAACYNNADFPNVDYKCTEGARSPQPR